MYKGSRIKELMQQKKITNKQMVEDFGWASHRQVYQVINGNPTASTLSRVAEYLGVPVSFFFTSENEQSPEQLHIEKGQNWDAVSALLQAKDETILVQSQRIKDLERIIKMMDERDSRGTI